MFRPHAEAYNTFVTDERATLGAGRFTSAAKQHSTSLRYTSGLAECNLLRCSGILLLEHLSNEEVDHRRKVTVLEAVDRYDLSGTRHWLEASSRLQVKSKYYIGMDF